MPAGISGKEDNEMSFKARYLMIAVVCIALVATSLIVISWETEEKLKEMQEIGAGPRGDIVYKNRCGACHQFDGTTSGKMNLGVLQGDWDADSLRSFIQLPPAPMVEWDGSPEELDVLIEYILRGPSEELVPEESE